MRLMIIWFTVSLSAGSFGMSTLRKVDRGFRLIRPAAFLPRLAPSTSLPGNTLLLTSTAVRPLPGTPSTTSRVSTSRVSYRAVADSEDRYKGEGVTAETYTVTFIFWTLWTRTETKVLTPVETNTMRSSAFVPVSATGVVRLSSSQARPSMAGGEPTSTRMDNPPRSHDLEPTSAIPVPLPPTVTAAPTNAHHSAYNIADAILFALGFTSSQVSPHSRPSHPFSVVSDAASPAPNTASTVVGEVESRKGSVVSSTIGPALGMLATAGPRVTVSGEGVRGKTDLAG